jgi:TonB family protein
MNGAPADRQKWLRPWWWGLVALVFGVQLAFIFWLGERKPIRPRPAGPAPVLGLASPASAEWMALTDPTLFALPHQRGFSGLAWLRVPAAEFHPFIWSDPSRWLEAAAETPGASFRRIMAANRVTPMPGIAQPEPDLRLSRLPRPEVSPGKSTLQLGGELAGRRLLTPCELPSFTCADLLTNSIVHLVVDADGRSVSSVLLSRSGKQEADDAALEQARAMRFEPLTNPGQDALADPLPGSRWGEAIFTWHTLPVPPTNAPPQP